MNVINSAELLENFVQNGDDFFLNFNQKKITITETNHMIGEDGGKEEQKEVEVYRVYQQWYNHFPTLRERRQTVIDAVNQYDKSNAVNTFKYNGKNYWLDRDVRVSVMNTTNILKMNGITKTTLWLGTDEYELDCDTVIDMLSDIEAYALECCSVTHRHINKINEISLEEAFTYDFEVGYPTPLEF